LPRVPLRAPEQRRLLLNVTQGNLIRLLLPLVLDEDDAQAIVAAAAAAAQAGIA
jgi:acetylornithine/succinyldiaminopimelate/putrescine aminotransferase